MRHDTYECVISHMNESRTTHMTEHLHRNGSDGHRPPPNHPIIAAHFRRPRPLFHLPNSSRVCVCVRVCVHPCVCAYVCSKFAGFLFDHFRRPSLLFHSLRVSVCAPEVVCVCVCVYGRACVCPCCVCVCVSERDRTTDKEDFFLDGVPLCARALCESVFVCVCVYGRVSVFNRG